MVVHMVEQGHRALSTVSQPVEPGDDLTFLIGGMIDLLLESRGLGLAANQVGVTKRVIVINTGRYHMCIVNPVIVKKSPNRGVGKEGCLSYPGIFVKKKRHKRIVVAGYDTKWNEVELKLSGKDAIVLQHEIDHLNGITIA